MLRADVGKSLLPDRYRGIGSATLQVMILKPLRWGTGLGLSALGFRPVEPSRRAPSPERRAPIPRARIPDPGSRIPDPDLIRAMPTLRADLHVHSSASRQTGSMRFLKSRDCYSSPEDVYRVAKARGMDLVALTDHDTIEGCLEFLAAHPDAPDFIMGEEVSCRFPDADLEVHLGVYGMTEALHRELQPLRRNVFDVTACLREAGVFFALNHLLFFYRGQVPLDAYLALLDEVPAVEARNGTMLAAHNDLVAEHCRPLAAAGGPAAQPCSAAATPTRCAASA